MRKSGAHQWSFSNKVSAVPQFLSFQTAPDQEKPRRSILDPVASSSSFLSISNADALDSANRRGSSAIMQKNWNFENKAESSHRAHPVIDAFPVGCSKDIRTFPVSNWQQHQPFTSTPIVQSHFASNVQSGYYGNSISIQQLRGVPVAARVPVVPATSSIIGTTELRNSPKLSGSPAQLTIFYAGSVCVYDDVSPEQAQAIMSMAKSGSTAPQTSPFMPTSLHTPPAIHNHLATDDHITRNRQSQTPPSSSTASPVSVSSSTSNEAGIARSLVASASIHTSSIPSSSSRPASAAPVPVTVGLPQVRIPQARKASLARFLEKRKERVTSSSSPYYNISKKSAEGHVCV
ncbi:Protein TIFY 6B [Linum grandiflorum]